MSMKVRDFTYVPILAAKMGELMALRELPTSTFDFTIPLLEVPPRLQAWTRDCRQRLDPKRTPKEHFDAVARQIQRAFEGRPCVWLDLPFLFEDEEIAFGPKWHAIDYMTQNLEEVGVAAIPVIGPERSAAQRAAVSRASKSRGRGAVIRIRREDFGAVIDGDVLSSLTGQLGLRPNEVDLLFDLGAIDETLLTSFVLAAEAVLRTAAVQSRPWRSLTLASGAFPDSVKEIARGIGAIRRVDLQLWETVCKRMPFGARRPAFSDYGIQSPGFADLPPNVTVAANIRYTSEMYWLVARGRPVRGRPSIVVPLEEYRGLARVVRAQPEFCGETFSPGDRVLAAIASDPSVAPGIPQTWRRHGTSHHVAFVARQLEPGGLQGVVGA